LRDLETTKMKFLEATKSVMRVDGDGGGRGFAVAGGRHGCLVFTAAHCLPFFPPCISFSGLKERTYRDLLSPLEGGPAVAAECLFVDPIADIAVLGSPDNQELREQAEAYDNLVESLPCLVIAEAAAKGEAWMLSLQNNWYSCTAEHVGGPLWMSDGQQAIQSGMSGSPVLNADGCAIGMVCASVKSGRHTMSQDGPNPNLSLNLPGWLLRAVAAASASPTLIGEDAS
jgi:hypothetical protein